jgi:large subunit ribosomal protein L22
MRPAPQGRGYRVRKRSNHVTLVVDAKGEMAEVAAPVVAEEVKAEEAPKKTTRKKATKK